VLDTEQAGRWDGDKFGQHFRDEAGLPLALTVDESGRLRLLYLQLFHKELEGPKTY
jgi:hypothetical protein